MPEPASHLGLYRTGLTSPEHRRHITVARQAMLNDTLELLRGSMTRGSKHHFLFLGPRGIGKTHLLSLIEDSIAATPELAAHYVVARFPEESNRLLSFADFLLRLCEILAEILPAEPLWRALYTKLRTEEDDSAIIDHLVPAIRQQNRERRRTLLIMLENLGVLLTSQIKNKTAIAALRKFFMDDNGCLLVATAPFHFSSVTNVEEPFYDFFDVQILNHLNEQETLELFRHNLEWEKREDLLAGFDALRPKLLALFRMTGGNPRLIIMLYELIAHDSITQVQQQFRILLDRITPFYQDRLKELPPQERAVLETMAAMRDREKTPASIAAQMRLNQPQTSSLLKRLTEARYLRATRHPADKRSRLYTIHEGFFDLWLAMNLCRSAQRRLPFLLDFFALFYPSLEEREKRRAALAQELPKIKYPDAPVELDYLSELGSPAEKAQSKIRLARLHAQSGAAGEARQYLNEAAALPLDAIGTWIVRHAEETISADYLTELQDMINCWEQYRSGNLEAFAHHMVKIGDALTYKSFSESKLAFLSDNLEHLTNPKERIHLRLKIGHLLHELARWADAEEQLRKSREEAEHLNDAGLMATSLNNLAQLLQATNRPAEAEPLMRRALAIDEQSYGPGHPAFAGDLNNLAQILQDTNRLAEAEPLMRRALAILEQSYGPGHLNVASALNNLALLLKATNRLAEAEPLMRRALVIDEQSYGPGHPNVAIRLNNLVALL